VVGTENMIGLLAVNYLKNFFLILSVTNNQTLRTKTGYSDLNNLGRALQEHNKSKEHIAFACKFVLFGKQNIATVIDPTATAIPC
jgi:NAD+--asparagine ADP-ribosyltransferase